MRRILLVLGAFLLAGIGISSATQSATQQKPDSPEPRMTPEDAAKKNPIAPTPEGLAEARKLFGYHCAMCHNTTGDGKGELATEMKLELHDWRDPATLEKMTDGELFFVISNGRGRMLGGEGDRTPEKMRWNLVNLVRTFAKKGAGDKAKSESPQN